MITGTQIRMARAALKIGVRELGELAGITANTIVRVESGADSYATTLTRLREALESKGVTFTESGCVCPPAKAQE